MAKLLYLESSPRKERSASTQVAGAFLEAYLKSHPDDSVEELDLWRNELAPFDGETINASIDGIGSFPANIGLTTLPLVKLA